MKSVKLKALLAVVIAAIVLSLAAVASAVNVPILQGSPYVSAKIIAPTFTVKAQGLTPSTRYQLSCEWAQGETGGGPKNDFGPLIDRTNLNGVAAFSFDQPTYLPNPPGILTCNVQFYGSAWDPFTGPGNGTVTFPDGSNGVFFLKLYTTTGP